jgi:hypothetical protein
MAIFESWMDDWTRSQIVTAFIRDLCPAEQREQVQALLASEQWDQLDAIMEPFHNIEQ